MTPVIPVFLLDLPENFYTIIKMANNCKCSLFCKNINDTEIL